MVESNIPDAQNKNLVSGSDVRAGNDIHIGDVYYHVSEKPQKATPNRGFLRFVALIVFVILSVFIGKALFKDPNVPKQNAAKIDTVEFNASGHDNPSSSSKTGVATNKLPQNEQSIAKPSTEIPQTPVEAPKINPPKTVDIKALVAGERLKISGNGKVRPFFINKYEVTVGQFHLYCKTAGEPFPHEQVDTTKSSYPMNFVTWNEADRYCKYVGGRLPTLDEWQEAAQSVVRSDTLMERDEKLAISWNRENSNGTPHSVGEKPPANGFQLYDIFGNVDEWCADGPRNGLKYTAGGFFYSVKIGLNEKTVTRANAQNETIGFRVVFQ
ncbi:MAG: formylglycine-generating enzyme family protein [Saprospiraceae bacterium]